mgnify:FL=1
MAETLAEPLGQPGQGGDELALRARQWYLDALNHPLWTEYIRESEEDEGFYKGGKGQWSYNGSTEDYDRLLKAGRTVVSINHIRPIVRTLLGLEQQNRFDLKAEPQGDEDPEDAQLLSWVLKFVQDQIELQDHESRLFDDGNIRGMSVMEVGVSWSEDPAHGTLTAGVLTPGREFLVDPYWEGYHFDDLDRGAKYCLKFRWGWVEDIVAQFPEHAEDIRAGVDTLDAAFDMQRTTSTTDGAGITSAGAPSRDGYGTVGSHSIESLTTERLLYDPDERRILVVEAWYREYESVWLTVNALTGKSEEAGSAEEARRLKAADPEHISTVRRLQRKIRMALVLPAVYKTLEDGASPYENDDEHYPFVPYIAERKGMSIYGIVRDLKDAQRLENKRRSQAMDIATKFANLRLMYTEGSVVNAHTLDEPHSTAPIEVRRGAGITAPSYLVPPVSEVVQLHAALGIQMQATIPQSSGINSDLTGERQVAESGIARARRQAQGQLQATPYFTNLARTRKLIGQRLARRIQQRFTMEDYLRLTNDVGAPVVVHINPPTMKHMSKDDFKRARLEAEQAGKPRILRDVSALKYDVTISEGPSTPSARAAQVEVLMDLLEKAPQLMPVLIEDIIRLSDIPNRAGILRRLQALLAGPGGPVPPQPGGGPSAPGGPGPSPVPPPEGPPSAMPGAGAPAPSPAAGPTPPPPPIQPPGIAA